MEKRCLAQGFTEKLFVKGATPSYQTTPTLSIYNCMHLTVGVAVFKIKILGPRKLPLDGGNPEAPLTLYKTMLLWDTDYYSVVSEVQTRQEFQMHAAHRSNGKKKGQVYMFSYNIMLGITHSSICNSKRYIIIPIPFRLWLCSHMHDNNFCSCSMHTISK